MVILSSVYRIQLLIHPIVLNRGCVGTGVSPSTRRADHQSIIGHTHRIFMFLMLEILCDTVLWFLMGFSLSDTQQVKLSSFNRVLNHSTLCSHLRRPGPVSFPTAQFSYFFPLFPLVFCDMELGVHSSDKELWVPGSELDRVSPGRSFLQKTNSLISIPIQQLSKNISSAVRFPNTRASVCPINSRSSSSCH